MNSGLETKMSFRLGHAGKNWFGRTMETNRCYRRNIEYLSADIIHFIFFYVSDQKVLRNAVILFFGSF